MTWTHIAENVLRDYVCALVGSKDTEEYQDMLVDIRHHIEEELSLKGLSTATEDSVNGIIDSMGGKTAKDTYAAEAESVINQSSVGQKQVKQGGFRKGASFFFMWLLGVILPSACLFFELVLDWASTSIFDPLPSVFHVISLVVMILTAAVYLAKFSNNEGCFPRWLKVALGFSVIVSIYYTILFAPMMPIGIVGILFFGLGFLILSPLLALIMHIKMLLYTGVDKYVWCGVVVAVTMFVLGDGRGILIQHQINQYAEGDREEKDSAINVLKKVASDEELLAKCYSGSGSRNIIGGPTEWYSSWFGLSRTSNEDARMLYYEVTGIPFNSIKPGKSIMSRRGAGIDDWSFDDAHGGDAVAGRIKGLSMTQSRMDVHIDSASQIGYAEWIVEFKNTSQRDREARMKFVLPHEGIISRLTLWVHGEEREAAYNSVSQVKKAYKQVAVVQRQDPVLVNMCAPNTYRLQCFPVLASGESMKMKVGYNFKVGDFLNMPFIQERNFDIHSDFTNHLFVQGKVEFPNDSVSGSVNEHNALKKKMSFTEFKSAEIALKLLSNPPAVVWTIDEDSGRYVRRKRMNSTISKDLTLVIDTSSRMATWQDTVTQVMKSDRVKRIILSGSSAEEISKSDAIDFSGGKDNVPALLKALQGENDVLWLHAGQPVSFGTEEGLIQELDRGFSKGKIYSICVAAGGNELLEKIWKQTRVVSHQYAVNPSDMMGKFENLGHGKVKYEWSETEPSEGSKVWDHLVHEAVYHEVEQAWLNGKMTTPLAKRASSYQLVTPVSGAVVLETEEQYKQAGLEAVSGEKSPTVPNVVPEPSSILLLMLGAVGGLFYRRR